MGLSQNHSAKKDDASDNGDDLVAEQSKSGKRVTEVIPWKKMALKACVRYLFYGQPSIKDELFDGHHDTCGMRVSL